MNFSFYVTDDHLDLRGLCDFDYDKLGEFLKSPEVSSVVRTISLSPGLISHDDLCDIFCALQAPYLESVNLVKGEGDQNCGVSDVDLGVLMASFRKSTRLSSINLRGNSSISAKGIAKTLLKWKSSAPIISLDLSGISIIGKNKELITDAIAFQKLSSLYLSGSINGDQDLEILIKVLYSKELTCLDLSKNSISDNGLEYLFQKDLISNLTNLNLSKNNISDRGLRVLANSICLKKLTNLDLSENNISFSKYDILYKNNFASLTTFNLSSNPRDKGITFINRILCGDLANITHLSLANIGNIHSIDIENMFSPSALVNLEYLDLSGNALGNGTIVALASINTEKLTQLHLNLCDITNNDLRVLVDSNYIKNLTYFALGDNKLTLSVLDEFIKHGAFQRSAFLDLSGIRACKEENYLAKGNIKNLASLVLANSEVDDEIINNLVNVINFTELEYLDLVGTKVSLPFIKGFIESHLRNLRSIFLSGNSDEYKETQSWVNCLSKAITNKLTLIFYDNRMEQAATRLRVVIPGSGSSSLNEDLEVVPRTPQIVVDNSYEEVPAQSPSQYQSIAIYDKYSAAKRVISVSDVNGYKTLELWIKGFSSDLKKNALTINIKKGNLDANCLRLLTDKAFKNLQSLILPGNKIDDRGAMILAKSRLPTLTKLDISDNLLTNKGIACLFRSNFSYLNASYCNKTTVSAVSTHGSNTDGTITQEGDCIVILPVRSSFIFRFIGLHSGGFAEHFLRPGVDCGKVFELNLKGNQITQDDLSALRNANVNNIHKLTLTSTGIDDSCAEVLASCNFSAGVKLSLGNNKIGNAGIKALSSAEFFKNLTLLCINDNKFDHSGLKHLEHLTFPKLEYLNLSNNRIGNLGVEYLASCSCKALRKLFLLDSGIGNEGIEHLISSNFNRLIELSLGSNMINDEGAIALIKAISEGKFLQIEKLNLAGNNNISNAVRGLLFRCCLKFVDASCQVSKSGHSASSSAYGEESYEEFSSMYSDKIKNFPKDSKFYIKNAAIPDGFFEKHFLYGNISCAMLSVLDLSGNHLSEDDMVSLIGADISNITKLLLSHAGITDKILEILDGASFSRLQVLDLEFNYITGEGALAVFKKDTYRKLNTEVFLGGNPLIDENYQSQLKDYVKLSASESRSFDRLRSEVLSFASSCSSSFASSCSSSFGAPNLPNLTSQNNSLSLQTWYPRSSTRNTSSFCVDIPPERSISAILPFSVESQSAGCSDMLLMNKHITVDSSFPSSALHAYSGNDITEEGSICNSTSTPRKRPNSLALSTYMPSKFAKTSEAHMSPKSPSAFFKEGVQIDPLLNTYPELERRRIGEAPIPLNVSNSSNFGDLPQSNLEVTEASRVSDLSKGKGAR